MELSPLDMDLANVRKALDEVVSSLPEGQELPQNIQELLTMLEKAERKQGLAPKTKWKSPSGKKNRHGKVKILPER